MVKLFESKYQEEHCFTAYNIMQDGSSKNRVCAELRITKQTLYNWCKEHPAFKLAIELGEVASEAHWEEKGSDGIIADGFSVAMYIIQMRNRFGWRATDPKETPETDNQANINMLAAALNMVNDAKKEVEGMKDGK